MFDKKALDGLLELSDDKLCSIIRALSGGEFPKRTPDGKTMAGIRGVLSEVTDADIVRALELISVYKRSRRN